MLFFWPFIVQRINPHQEALCNVEIDEGRYLIEAHVVLLAFYSPENNPHLEALCDVEVDEWRYLIKAHVVLLCIGLCLQGVHLALEGQVKTIPDQNLHKAAR
jgi:hypothetical protein